MKDNMANQWGKWKSFFTGINKQIGGSMKEIYFTSDEGFLELVSRDSLGSQDEFFKVIEELTIMVVSKLQDFDDYKTFEISAWIYYDEYAKLFSIPVDDFETAMWQLGGFIIGFKKDYGPAEEIEFFFLRRKAFHIQKNISISSLDVIEREVKQLVESLTADMIVESFDVEAFNYEESIPLNCDVGPEVFEYNLFYFFSILRKLKYDFDSPEDSVQLTLNGYRLNQEETWSMLC